MIYLCLGEEVFQARFVPRCLEVEHPFLDAVAPCFRVAENLLVVWSTIVAVRALVVASMETRSIDMAR